MISLGENFNSGRPQALRKVARPFGDIFGNGGALDYRFIRELVKYAEWRGWLHFDLKPMSEKRVDWFIATKRKGLLRA